ncbi:MAG: BrnT family toxin [Xanthobacteraceae bacterium]
MVVRPSFEWDGAKDCLGHSRTERRYFCFGSVDGAVMTVRFTYRKGRIRIFGAGYWRKGKEIYEKQSR